MATELEIGSIAITVMIATILAFVARHRKQPTVIAYVLTGAILGPIGLSIVSSGTFTRTASELGLSFLLFFIGLEIDLEQIQEVAKPSFLIAGINMLITASGAYLLSLALGFGTYALFIAVAFSFSSTAVVVKLLADSDQLATLPGKLDVGMLLVQDLAVVVVLSAAQSGISNPIPILFHLGEVVLIASLIAFTSVTAGKKILSRWFNQISDDKHAFFIHGIAWLFIALVISGEIGLSKEIGAFLAGLSLAQIPYSSELKEEVRPLTDLFMAIFFIDIGLRMAPDALIMVQEAVIATAILVPLKFIGFFGLTDKLKFTPETSFKSSINMVQVSEFALVLGAIGLSGDLITKDVMSFISLTTVISMALSSYLIAKSGKLFGLFEKYLKVLEDDEKKDFNVRKLEDHAVIIGYDKIGESVAEILQEEFEKVIIIDRNSKNSRELGKSSYEYIFGDFKHGEIRNAAGLKDASFIISLSPEFEANLKTVEEAEDATVFVKAESVEEAAELYDLGAHYVIMKNELSSEKVKEYIRLWNEKPEIFREEVEKYRENLEDKDE